MAHIVCPPTSVEDGPRLEPTISDRIRFWKKHVARTRIILDFADQLGGAGSAYWPAVWRWQRRFVETGVNGLLRDVTCKPPNGPYSGTNGAPGGGTHRR